MKKRRVVKLFSVGMAGILGMSPCNMAGNVVYAQVETVQSEEAEFEEENATKTVEGLSEEMTKSEKMSNAEQSKEEITVK